MYIVLSRGCAHAQERDIAVANPVTPWAVSKIDIKTYYIRAYEKDESERCHQRDIAAGNHVTPLTVIKIDKSIPKRIIFGRTKRTGAKVAINEISTGCLCFLSFFLSFFLFFLFLFCVVRGGDCDCVVVVVVLVGRRRVG